MSSEIEQIEAILRDQIVLRRMGEHSFMEGFEEAAAAIAALRAQDREDGAREMRSPKLRTPLTEAEREFIAEMSHEDDGRADHWQNFDPDFRQRDIARLLRLGWAERRERNGYREYRWTEAGRLALAEQEMGR